MDADSVNLTFDTTVTASDKNRFCIKVFTDIPAAGLTLPVNVTVNGALIPLLNKYGNPVLGADLSRCRVYKGYYGATTPHVILQNNPAHYYCNCANIA